VDTVEVPRWSEVDLSRVLDKGAASLGIEFSSAAISALLSYSQQSIGLLQDLAYITCSEAGVGANTGHLPEAIGAEVVERATQRILDRSIGRLRWYASTFADPKKRRDLRAQPYKGMLHVLLRATEGQIRDGISTGDLLAAIQELYPYETSDLTEERVEKALSRLGSVHRTVQASPVLGYDASGARLHVVDPLFRLFLTTSNEDSLINCLPDQGWDTEPREDSEAFAGAVRELYGNACAVCTVSNPVLVTVRRLSKPPLGHGRDPRYGLPFCLNHAKAWDLCEFGIEPDTTKIVGDDVLADNLVRADLTHLKTPPEPAALEEAWRSRVAYLSAQGKADKVTDHVWIPERR
jgi:hypothetical protein